jgi:hypothetical protein
MSDQQSRLAAEIDGAPLPEDKAREIWTKFSEHMDEHRGDMTGFAKLHGYARVSPEARRGQAVLVIQTTEGAARPQPPARPPGESRAPTQKPRPAQPPPPQGGGGKRPKRRR